MSEIYRKREVRAMLRLFRGKRVDEFSIFTNLTLFLCCVMGLVGSSPAVCEIPMNPLPTHLQWQVGTEFQLDEDTVFSVMRPQYPIHILALSRHQDSGWKRLWTANCPSTRIPYHAWTTSDAMTTVLLFGGNSADTAITVMDGKGNVLKSYTLGQLLPETEIRSLPHTDLSPGGTREWANRSLFFLREQETQFVIVSPSGTTRIIDMKKGALIPLPLSLDSTLRHDAILEARKMAGLPGADIIKRVTGVKQIGRLRDLDSEPMLLRLLTDQSSEMFHVDMERHRVDQIFEVALAAGESLLKLE